MALLALIASPLLNPAWAAEAPKPQKALPLPGERFAVEGCTGFVMLPEAGDLHARRPIPWVWYAPTLPNLPEARENWMFERFLVAGIAWSQVGVGLRVEQTCICFRKPD